MLLSLDHASATPLYEQLVAELRGAVLRGEVGPGDRLPPARDLAASLGINMHTVLRAYGTLRDEGLIQLRRGRGAVVTDVPLDTTEWDQAVRHLLAVAARLGMSQDDIHAALARHLAQEQS